MVSQKILIATLLLCGCQAKAQINSFEIPGEQIYATDFDYPRNVAQVANLYYEADSTGYDPSSLVVHSFNEQRKITADYSRIFGEYGSETAKLYAYKNGRLDSLTTIASNNNFSSKSKYYYSNKLDSISTSGILTNSVSTFAYDDKGRMIMKTTLHKSGTKIISEYSYQSGKLDYIKISEPVKDRFLIKHTYYLDNKKFATYTQGAKTLTLFCSDKSEVEKPYSEDRPELINKLRKLRLTDSAEYSKAEQDFIIDAKSVFKQPATSTDEQGLLVRWYEVENRYGGMPTKRFCFRRYTFPDKRTTGTTDFDMFFQQQVQDRLGEHTK